MHHHDASELAKIAKLPAIAFATASIENVLSAAKRASDAEQVLRAMLAELWAWQAAQPTDRPQPTTEKEARKLPSSRFYATYQARLLELVSAYGDQQSVEALLGAAIANISFIVWLIDQYEQSLYPGKPLVLGNFYSSILSFAALRDQHREEPRVHALLSGVVHALTFIVWIMEGTERALNRGKPKVVGDEIGEDGWDGLARGFDELARSALDPDAERAWQLKTVERVAADHPGSLDGEVLGRPVEKRYFVTP